VSEATAYPLYWPAGWKRATSRSRADFGKEKTSTHGSGDTSWTVKSKEKLTVSEGCGRVLATLRRMGVPDYNTIVSTNVRTRLDGLPYSNQAEPSDPGVAVYWKKNGKRQCMAVDRYNRVADNLAAIAATLEAMRAIERHGGAEILERAFLGFQSLPPPMQGGRPWQEVLGYSEHDAGLTLKEAEDKYRCLAKNCHPDNGGDSDKMSELNEAIRQARQALAR
jgi:hypothetical protein